jgi:hypothetical protein
VPSSTTDDPPQRERRGCSLRAEDPLAPRRPLAPSHSPR